MSVWLRSVCAICSRCIFLYLIFTLKQNNWLWGCPSRRNYLSVLYSTVVRQYMCGFLFFFCWLVSTISHMFRGMSKKNRFRHCLAVYAAEMCIFNALGLSVAKRITSPDCRHCTLVRTKVLTNKMDSHFVKSHIEGNHFLTELSKCIYSETICLSFGFLHC